MKIWGFDMVLINPSSTPFTSFVVLFKKKDGTMRMCINYRNINKKMVNKKYPSPRINEMMDDLHREN